MPDPVPSRSLGGPHLWKDNRKRASGVESSYGRFIETISVWRGNDCCCACVTATHVPCRAVYPRRTTLSEPATFGLSRRPPCSWPSVPTLARAKLIVGTDRYGNSTREADHGVHSVWEFA